jgi:integrase
LIFDQVMAGTFRWPDGLAQADDPQRLGPTNLTQLVEHLRASLVGEQLIERTWKVAYQPYLAHLIYVAEKAWPSEVELLTAALKRWQVNSKARQMAHDRYRRLWNFAGWDWPESIAELRGNGKAARPIDGVRAFSDEEITQLRELFERSLLKPRDVVSWDLLIVFGLRPAELAFTTLHLRNGHLVAELKRPKETIGGKEGHRLIPAVPPPDWPSDCFDLLERWKEHGLPPLAYSKTVGEGMSQQLRRARKAYGSSLSSELSSYSARHAFALRLAQHVGLHVREAAALMGHSPQTHIQQYGRRLDMPSLLDKVQGILQTA